MNHQDLALFGQAILNAVKRIIAHVEFSFANLKTSCALEFFDVEGLQQSSLSGASFILGCRFVLNSCNPRALGKDTVVVLYALLPHQSIAAALVALVQEFRFSTLRRGSVCAGSLCYPAKPVRAPHTNGKLRIPNRQYLTNSSYRSYAYE